jgi:hypothetical protein
MTLQADDSTRYTRHGLRESSLFLNLNFVQESVERGHAMVTPLPSSHRTTIMAHRDRLKISPLQPELLTFHLVHQVTNRLDDRISKSAYPRLNVRAEHGANLGSVAHQEDGCGRAYVHFRFLRAQRCFSGLEFDHHRFNL